MGSWHRIRFLLVVCHDKAWLDSHLLDILHSLQLSGTGAVTVQMASGVKHSHEGLICQILPFLCFSFFFSPKFKGDTNNAADIGRCCALLDQLGPFQSPSSSCKHKLLSVREKRQNPQQSFVLLSVTLFSMCGKGVSWIIPSVV